MLILSYIICFDVIRYFSSYGILFGYYSYHRLMIWYCIVFAFIVFAFSKCNIVIYYGRKEVLKSNFWQCGQMKSRDEKCQWTEEKKKEEKRRESQKKEDPGARKGRKVTNPKVFPMMCGSGGSKSRLAKAASAEPSETGQMREENLHAVVARSTFASAKARNLTFGLLLEVAMSKKCMPWWHEAHAQVKNYKTHCARSIFGSWVLKKCRCGAKRVSKSKCERHSDI